MKAEITAALNALRSAITRGKVSTTATLFQKRAVLQFRGYAGETRDKIELMQPYGMSSRPLAGGDVLAIQIGLQRDHTVVIHVDDPALRIADLAEGEFGFRDQNGTQVVWRKDRLEVTTPKKVVVNATGEVDVTSQAKIRLVAPDIEIHATANLKFDCDGNGTHIRPATRDDYVIGSVGTAHNLNPAEIP